MSWEEANKDLDAYQQMLTAQQAAGAEGRVAEGRAPSSRCRAWPPETDEASVRSPRRWKEPCARAHRSGGRRTAHRGRQLS